MKNKKLMAVVFVSFAAFRIFGQTDITPPIMNWGDTVCGSALSIAMSNNVITAGTNLPLSCWIKNSSANIVYTAITTPTKSFYAYLTNSSGQFYELTRRPENHFIISRMVEQVNPGQTKVCDISIFFSTNISRGKYGFLVEKEIVINEKRYHLVSKAFDIQIK